MASKISTAPMPRPPGPKGRLLSGHNDKFAIDRLGFLLDLSRTYGPVASFRLFHHRILLISDPDLIEQVLVHDARHYIKHFGARAYKVLLGQGLVTSEGEVWRQQRRLIQPALLKTQVHSYAPAMVQETHRMLAGWSNGQRTDVHAEFTRLSSRIALKALFNLDDEGNSERFGSALRIAIDLINKRLRSIAKMPSWFPSPLNLRLNAAVASLTKDVDGYIAAGRSRREPGQDLLSRLIAAQNTEGMCMSDRQLRDEAMTMYISAHETTALALSWTWYLLAKHPEAEQRVAAELSQVLGGRDPAPGDLSSLSYLMAVLCESLRLYPPVHLFGREALTDLEIGGFRVKRGETVIMSSWVSQRDPRHFADPDSFDPARWLDGLSDRIPKYAYYPFSGGQRMCIGSSFALTEAALVLAIVIAKYRPTVDATSVGLHPQITLQPRGGIPATLEARP